MRILYLPDWNEKGAHLDVKLKLMRNFGCDVRLTEFNYHDRNFIHNLANEFGREPTLVVGNAIGAYFSFYVSNLMSVPALLFNPSFYFKNGGELKSNSNDRGREYLDKKIILSTKDENIDTKRTFKFLKELGYDSQIKIVDNYINNSEFENFFADFFTKYKDIKNQDDELKSKKREPYHKSKVRYEPIIEPIEARAHVVRNLSEIQPGIVLGRQPNEVYEAAAQLDAMNQSLIDRETTRAQGQCFTAEEGEENWWNR